jgi:hypothetical protein
MTNPVSSPSGGPFPPDGNDPIPAVIKNAWRHPKTTLGGVAAFVVLFGTVLAQNGVTLGHVGTSNWVVLAVGLATALGGSLAKDPS